jgi:hypothetical protein
VNKRNANALNNMLEAWVRRIGGQVLEETKFFTWQVMTFVGPLGIHRVIPSGPCESIFACFDIPTVAHRQTQCNPFSGKWNKHCPLGTSIKAMFEELTREVEDLCIMPPTRPIGLLWTRPGDNCDYGSHVELDHIAEELHELGVREITHHNDHELFASGFEGHNFISFFWGDQDAQLIRGTMWAERQYVIDALAKLCKKVAV